MALIKCPECGYSVSEHAAACMRCRFPISKSHPANIDYSGDITDIYAVISTASHLFGSSGGEDITGNEAYADGIPGNQAYDYNPPESQAYTDGAPGNQAYAYDSPESLAHADGSPGSQAYTDGSSGNQAYTDGSPGSQVYTDGSPGSQAYTDGSSGNQVYSYNSPENQIDAAYHPGNQAYPDGISQTDPDSNSLTHADAETSAYADNFSLSNANAKSGGKSLSTNISMPRKIFLIPLIVVIILTVAFLIYSNIVTGRVSYGSRELPNSPSPVSNEQSMREAWDVLHVYLPPVGRDAPGTPDAR